MQIKLIVGLGNPGKEYENTRHNVGFIFINSIKKIKKLNNIAIEKTDTFMNKSGEAVRVLAKFYLTKGEKMKPENILIVHDDIDILWNKFKFSFGRSSAGHKGVESIIKALRTKNFWRLRIGIHPLVNQVATNNPTNRVHQDADKQAKIKADKIILKKFTDSELESLYETIKKAVSDLETAL